MAFHISIEPCSPSLASFCLKWFCEKQLTRFAQCHGHTYMFNPYAISTLYHVLEELQVRSSKDTFSCAILLTNLHLLREMN
jgi:hypothetical protein